MRTRLRWGLRRRCWQSRRWLWRLAAWLPILRPLTDRWLAWAMPAIAGGKGTSIPPPSAEERELQATQTALLKRQTTLLEQQMKEQGMLAPILAQQAGLEIVRDPKTGEVLDIREKAKTPEDEAAANMAKDIQRLELQRTMAALKGELPVDAALVQGLAEEEARLNEQMVRNLGPGWQASTPGIEAGLKFAQRKQVILDAARRGDLGTAQALAIQQEQANQARLNEQLARMAGAIGYPYTGLAQMQGLGAGYSTLWNQMANERWRQFGASNQGGGTAAGIAGGLGGAASGAGMGAAIGSVVPGVGTGIGALAGAIIGGVGGGLSGAYAR